MRSVRAGAIGGLLISAAVIGRGEASAQADCVWLEGSGDLVYQNFGSTTVTYVGTPRLRCSDGVSVVADSAVFYDASSLYEFLGTVRLDDPETRLDAERVQYFQNVGRIDARDSVRLLRRSDSTSVSGERLEYLRPSQTRPIEQLTVTGGRPHAVLQPRSSPDSSSASGPREPYIVDADRIFIRGGDEFRAYGTVELSRAELDASADTVEYNGASSRLILSGNARLEAEAYDLTASNIVVDLPDDQVRFVLGRDDAVLTGEDLSIRAPLIHVLLTDGLLDRLVAFDPLAAPRASPPAMVTDPEAAPPAFVPAQPPAPVSVPPPGDSPGASSGDTSRRPVALARGFEVTADSLDVLAPLEVLHTVFAAGRAHAVSTARDSLNTESTPDIARRDWIDGDTVIATFLPVEPDESQRPEAPARAEDEREEYALERLVAKINAATLYRMVASDTTGARGGTPADSMATAPGSVRPKPAIHYVVGDSITIVLAEGEVQTMKVVGQVRGIHLEPGSGSGEAEPGDDERGSRDTSAPSPSGTGELPGGVGSANRSVAPGGGALGGRDGRTSSPHRVGSLAAPRPWGRIR